MHRRRPDGLERRQPRLHRILQLHRREVVRAHVLRLGPARRFQPVPARPKQVLVDEARKDANDAPGLDQGDALVFGQRAVLERRHPRRHPRQDGLCELAPETAHVAEARVPPLERLPAAADPAGADGGGVRGDDGHEAGAVAAGGTVAAKVDVAVPEAGHQAGHAMYRRGAARRCTREGGPPGCPPKR